MKFRDPKTGKVFENIEAAMNCFCYESLRPCNKCNFNSKNCGKTWAHDHPAEAARLMGYEVIEDEPYDSSGTCGTCEDFTPLDSAGYGRCERSGKILPSEHKCGQKEDNMDKQDKPRLAEVLGVEEDEKWRYPECAGLYRVHNGVREYWDENNGWLYCDCEEDLVKIIAHPESIIRTPRLTEPEIAIMRAVGARWVSKDWACSPVYLWNCKPTLYDGVFMGPDNDRKSVVAIMGEMLFPSVHPQELIELEADGDD